MNKKEISVLFALILTIGVSVCGGSIHTAERIKANTLRLHIIANSDTEKDQQLKLQVRDLVMDMENLLPTDKMSFEQAKSTLDSNMSEIEKNINGFLAENNADYTASCSLENFYFDTTQYADFALPQGEYAALTVRIGKAQGKNWWCVVYPQLCSQSCGKAALENSDEFIKTDKIIPRFKVVELYEDIKGIFEERTQQYTRIG